MALRIPWDKYETAILIDACIQVINHKVDKGTAIQIVSSKLRKRAVKSGVTIDNIFRNETGIRMQMNTIMSIIQGEEPGLSNASKLFYEMVELYRSEYLTFSAILKEANNQVSDIEKPKAVIEKLKISNHEVEAVFFHKPDEPFGFLSNWFYSPFEINNTKYISTAQYIMHQKCMLFGDEESAKAILATEYPEKQQCIAKKTKGVISNVWVGSRQLIAIRGIQAKFNQNGELKNQLLETNNAYLVECNHSDTVWTCGERLNEPDRFDASKWKGQNLLGFSLMEVRKSLQAPQKF